MPGAQRPNPRLASAASAYLRSAAHQPVEWHTWGDDAFAEARRRDVPVLLDIGAVWCHWCHVMDHESYDDPDLARLINERFVPVKVDRDERPDVDTRYQRLVSAIAGQGGWPLTGFLAPDGRVFYGGTYFPPADAHGRPSFRRVLEAIHHAWTNDRAAALEQAGHIEAALEDERRPATTRAGALDAQALAQAAQGLDAHADRVNGGWGGAPKFPHPGAVEFLLARLERGDAAVRGLVEGALDGPARGGVRDHVGGGFHRYSVDAQWLVPHFEKMLYDNAELLRNYTHAHRILGKATYAEAAHETARFLEEVLSDRADGGFYGSQDADVGPHDDGDHFTWTADEVRAAIADEPLARLALLHYGVGQRGQMHGRPGRYVLHVEADMDELAAARGADPDVVRTQLAEARRRLAAARAKRPVPFIDPVRYTNWNAMAIRAGLDYGTVLDRPAAVAFALRTLDRFVERAYDRGKGFAHTLDPGSPRGLLDDQAQMLVALVAGFNASQKRRYLDVARDVADHILAEYAASDRPGFQDVARTRLAGGPASPLARPQRPVQDAPSPSANARAIEGLLRLSDVVPEGERYAQAARDAARTLWPETSSLGIFGGALLLASQLVVDAPPKVIVAGPAADERVAALHAAALRHGPLGTQVVVAVPGQDLPALPPDAKAFADGPARTRPGAIVCHGMQCQGPAVSADALLALLRPGPLAASAGRT